MSSEDPKASGAMRVLIAYDGSGCADSALLDLARAGLPREVDVTILSVTEVWLTLPSNLKSADATDPAQPSGDTRITPEVKLVRKARAVLAARHPAWHIETGTATGSPAREILRRARETKAGLIVIGSQGGFGVNRLFLGSVSHKVANEAPCSVRVVRGSAWKEGAPARLLIGFDGSAAARAAVRSVRERVWAPGSEVRLVAVVDPEEPSLAGKRGPPWRKSADERNRAVRAWIEQSVIEAVDELRQTQLVVTSRIAEGDPKRALVAEAEEWGADCIFIGSSGAPGDRAADPLERLLLGSVATAIVARAGGSVEVVRIGPERANR